MHKAKTNIKNYGCIEDYYSSLGQIRKPPLKDFDILNFDQAGSVKIKFMPPFRKDFYQIVFKLNPKNSRVSLNTLQIKSEDSLLLFQSPHHIYTWQRNTELKGFVLFFNAEFIENLQSFENEFTFSISPKTICLR